ncbi:MAG: ElyC/SanA/YdcF family protein, partial [Bacteroidia bacterium]
SVEILKKDFAEQKFLLVTSGYHMRRSLACFKKAGIKADPFSVDEHSGKGQFTVDKILVPDAECLDGWDSLLHEWVGYLSYWIAGYI